MFLLFFFFFFLSFFFFIFRSGFVKKLLICIVTATFVVVGLESITIFWPFRGVSVNSGTLEFVGYETRHLVRLIQTKTLDRGCHEMKDKWCYPLAQIEGLPADWRKTTNSSWNCTCKYTEDGEMASWHTFKSSRQSRGLIEINYAILERRCYVVDFTTHVLPGQFWSCIKICSDEQ